MSWNDYPALGERCYLETLPNGLRLRVVPKPGFAGKFAFLGVNVGSCDTQLPLSGGWQTVPDGTAHFLEHRMFCLRKTPFGQFRKLTQNFLLNGGQVCTAASGGCGQDAFVSVVPASGLVA